MRDGDDPFMRVLDFMGGRDERAVKLGLKLEGLLESIVCNVFMAAYMLFSAVIVLLIISPLLLASGNPALRGVGAFMHVGAGLLQLCHQLPYRSFILDGIPMPVCARDVGIYLGFIAGFATVLLKDRPKMLSSVKLPLLCTIPIAADGVTQTMLLLRESNNTIRLITGLIFSFGVAAYLANRLLARMHPEFRRRVLDGRALAVDSAAVAVILYLVFTGAGDEINMEYMGRSAAVERALTESGIKEPVEVRAYYIGSMAALSVMEDPYYERHRDLILDDVRASGWARERAGIFNGSSDVLYTMENKTTMQYLTEIAEREHKFGVWAVAVMERKPVKGEAPFISSGNSEILFYDALTGKLITKTAH